MIDHTWSSIQFFREPHFVQCGIYNHLLIFAVLDVQNTEIEFLKKFWDQSLSCIRNFINEVSYMYGNYVVTSSGSDERVEGFSK